MPSGDNSTRKNIADSRFVKVPRQENSLCGKYPHSRVFLSQTPDMPRFTPSAARRTSFPFFGENGILAPLPHNDGRQYPGQ
jgi:hypothetical protein